MSQPERCQRWRDVKDGEDIGNERYSEGGMEDI